MIHDRYKHFGSYGGKEPRQKLMKDSDTALYVPNLKENDTEISMEKFLNDVNISLKSISLKTNKSGERYFIIDFGSVSIKDSAIQKLQVEGYIARPAWEKQKDDANLYCEFPKEYTENDVDKFFTQHLVKTESKGRISSIKMLHAHAQIQPCMVRFSDSSTAQAVLQSAKKESNFDINFALKNPQKSFNRYSHVDNNNAVYDRTRQSINGANHNYANYFSNHRPMGVIRNNVTYLAPVQHQFQQPNLLYPNGSVPKTLHNNDQNISPIMNVNSNNNGVNGVPYSAQNHVHISQTLPPSVLAHSNTVSGLSGIPGSPYSLPNAQMHSQVQQINQIGHKIPNPVTNLLQNHTTQHQQQQQIHTYQQNSVPAPVHHSAQSLQSVMPLLLQPQYQDSYPNSNHMYNSSASTSQMQFPNAVMPMDQLTCQMGSMNLNGHYVQHSFAPVPLQNGQYAYAPHPNPHPAYFIQSGLESYHYLNQMNNAQQCNPVSTSATPSAVGSLKVANGQQPGIMTEQRNNVDQNLTALQVSASS